MNKIDILFSFVIGAAAGSVVTWEVCKDKFNLGPCEEIVDNISDDKPIQVDGIEGVKKNAKDIIREQEYVAYNKSNEKEEEEESMKNSGPYVITPDEYDCSEYEPTTLNYYADGVLTDIYDNKIDNIDEIVGLESLNHFGEYEEDTVYVRDDNEQRDYEILRNSEEYYELYPDERNK